MSENATLKSALDALEKGDKAKARELLKQAVEEQPESVEAWVALSKVTEDVDERRIALSTILQLDPENAYAQEGMSAADAAKDAKRQRDGDLVPGIPRTLVRQAVIGLTLYTIVMLGLGVLVSSNITSGKEAQRSEATALAVNATQRILEVTAQIQADNTQVAQLALEGTQTAAATITPTITLTPTRSRPTLPPEASPTAEISPTAALAFLAPTVTPGLPGRLVVWGGRSVSNPNFLSLFSISPGTDPSRLNDNSVQNVAVSQGGVLVYQYALSGGSAMRYTSLGNPTAYEELDARFVTTGVQEARLPRISRDGQRIVFIGYDPVNRTTAVYLYDVPTQASFKLSSDAAEYLGASISPDGRYVVVVKRAATGVDLFGLDVQRAADNYPQTPITRDGDATVEGVPDFSPDSTQIVYDAYTGNPQDRNLYISRLQYAADAVTSVGDAPIFTTPEDQSRPFFSPDGSYLAFNVAVNGQAQVFLLNNADRTQLFQVTSGQDPYYLGGWSN